MKRWAKIAARKTHRFVILMCGVQIFMLSTALGKSMKQGAPPQSVAKSSVLMPDLLKELEARRVNKRNTKNYSKSDRHKTVSFHSHRKLFRNNFVNTQTENREWNRTNDVGEHVNMLELAVKPKSYPKRHARKSHRDRKRLMRLKSKVRHGVSNRSRQRSTRTPKSKKFVANKKNRNSKHLRSAKYDKSFYSGFNSADNYEGFDFLSENNLPLRLPTGGYHLVPYARMYPMYRTNMIVYPSMQRNRFFEQDPYYNYRYYLEGDAQRKDVIPKPHVVPLIVRGTKKDAFYKDPNHKRMTYSPIVSAVQNLDRSEANLFDSLLSAGHETNRVPDYLGNELSNFVGTPDDLEVYAPSDTPGEVYFEKEQKDNNAFGSHLATSATSKPTEAELDPADIVDNEERLLAIVEKVIEKQKKENAKSKSLKLQHKTGQVKGKGDSLDIGDTSKVFNTGSGEKELNAESKLQDFLSKQPKYMKKVKSSKQANVSHRKVKANEHYMVKAKGHKQNPGFMLSKTGQHVIVEHMAPNKDKLLVKSLAELGGGRAQRIGTTHGSSYSDVQRIENKMAAAKSLSKVEKNEYSPHIIKEVTNEDRKGGLSEESNSDFAESNGRSRGFEKLPLSIHEAYTSRYKINGKDIPVVSEVNPSEWFSNEKKSNPVITGIKKDEDKMEDKPQPEKEAESNEKEATKEPTSTEENSSSEEPKGEKPKEDVAETNGTASTENTSAQGNATASQKPAAIDEKADANKTAAQEDNEEIGSLEELFGPVGADDNTQPTATPPSAAQSPSSPDPGGHMPGWRIRDYYLDSNNASKWDQLRTAWMGKNNSQFVFSNRININPQGTIDSPLTPPPIRFVNGITMPILPTIKAPTDIPSHGFPMDNDGYDEDDSEAQQQQQQQQQNINQNPRTTPSYGLQYPWQWHNRRPQGSRYNYPKLQFHGRPTYPTLRPVVVTAREPTTVAAVGALTEPTNPLPSKAESNDAAGAVGEKNEGFAGDSKKISNQKGETEEEKLGKEKAKEEAGRNEGGGQPQGEDNTQKAQEESKVKSKGDGKSQSQKEESTLQQNEQSQNSSSTGEDNVDKEQERINGNEKSGLQSDAEKILSVGHWRNDRKDESVIEESVTHKNSTVRRLNETLGAEVVKDGSNLNVNKYTVGKLSKGNVGTYTKAPEELPILSQPTTKSVQSFLPGVRPPGSINNQLQSEKSGSYPPWSGAYVKQLRNAGWAGLRMEGDTNGDARSDSTWKQGGKRMNAMSDVLAEESLKKIPYDEEVGSKREKTENSDSAARNSFAYESSLLQKEESENAATRARVTDSPLTRQAESINEIRHRATAAQRAAQRQIVLADNTTNEKSTQNESYGKGNNASSSHGKAVMIPEGRQMEGKPIVAQSTHATATPKATATTPITEEFHHPTPKPLFPFVISSKLPTAEKVEDSKEKKKLPENSSGQLPKSLESIAHVSNASSPQRNLYLPIAFETPQATTESTTPSIFGYKTTDWAKAFTTKDSSQSAGSHAKNGVSNNGEDAKKLEHEVSGAGLSKKISKEPVVEAAQATPLINKTVTEGEYQTDRAKLRTTEKVIQNITGKTRQTAPTLAASSPLVNIAATSGYLYQVPYPSIGNAAIGFAQQPSLYSGYQGWPAAQKPTTSFSTMQSTEPISDSYLTKFGDQLNMEDLYWTDSTEEKEQICKQEKGTNEVVHILCFGDSLTRGYYNKGKSHHPYTNKLQFLLNKLDTKKCYIIENEGKDGELAYEEMPKRLESSLKDADTKYDWIVILGGTNDIYNKQKSKSVSEDAITQNIISMHEIARKHNSKSVAVTIPEVFCETQETCQDAKQLREKVNNNIRSYAVRNPGRVVLVDLADMLQRANVGRDMVAQFFEGGLHLKPRGYERMAIIIYEGLKRALS